LLSYTVFENSTEEIIHSLPFYIHQHVKLGDANSTVVSKSKDKNAGNVKKEQVLHGLEVGLQGMCKGESRLISFSKNLGCGKARRCIPDIPNEMLAQVSTLGFNITLHHITSEEEYIIFDFYENQYHAEVLEMIHSHKGVNAVDKWGSTILMYAIQDSKTTLVASLLNAVRPKVDINIAKPSGHTALLYCMMNDDHMYTEALLKMGADPNVSVKNGANKGWTPLHFACKFEQMKNIKILLDYGANALAKTQDDQTPFEVFPTSRASRKNREMVKKMIMDALPVELHSEF